MEYITIQDIDSKGYYQLDKKLFNNPYYQNVITRRKKIPSQKYINGRVEKVMQEIETVTRVDKLSDTSKILYSFLLDQLNLSIANGWWDEERRVYVKFSIAKLALLMNKSKDTIVKCKKELESVELIQIVSGDIFEADAFYLGKVKDRPLDLIEQEFTFCDTESTVSTTAVEDVDTIKVDRFQEKKAMQSKVSTQLASSSSYINTTTAISNTKNISTKNNNILEILKSHGVSNGTIQNILNIPRELTEDEVAAALSQMKEKGWGEGALYKALRHEWIKSSPAAAVVVSVPEEVDSGIDKLVKGTFDHCMAMFECLEKTDIAKQTAIDSFVSDIKRRKPVAIQTEYYRYCLKTLSSLPARITV